MLPAKLSSKVLCLHVFGMLSALRKEHCDTILADDAVAILLGFRPGFAWAQSAWMKGSGKGVSWAGRGGPGEA